MKKLILALVASVTWAQTGPATTVGISPVSDTQWTLKTEYSGGYAIYIGKARSFQATRTTWTVGGSPSLTSIVVATNVATITTGAAHGLSPGNGITVAASGTAALNGVYRLITASGTTGTFATSGVADGTYNVAATTIESEAPRTNANVWAITYLVNDGSGNATSIQSCGRNKAWDSRATYGCN